MGPPTRINDSCINGLNGSRGLQGFQISKKATANLILTLENYLLDILSPRGPTMFGAGGKILGFGVPRWPENAFPNLVP